MSELDLILAGYLQSDLSAAGLLSRGTEEPTSLWTHLSPICQSQLIFLLGLHGEGASLDSADLNTLCANTPLDWLIHHTVFNERMEEETGQETPQEEEPDIMQRWIIELNATDGERRLSEMNFSWNEPWDGQLWPLLSGPAQNWKREHSPQIALPEALLIDLWSCAESILGEEGEVVSLLHWHDGEQHAALVICGSSGRSAAVIRTLKLGEGNMWTQFLTPAFPTVKRSLGGRERPPLEWEFPGSGVMRAFMGQDDAVISAFRRLLPAHWKVVPELIRAEAALLRQDQQPSVA